MAVYNLSWKLKIKLFLFNCLMSWHRNMREEKKFKNFYVVSNDQDEKVIRKSLKYMYDSYQDTFVLKHITRYIQGIVAFDFETKQSLRIDLFPWFVWNQCYINSPTMLVSALFWQSIKVRVAAKGIKINEKSINRIDDACEKAVKTYLERN